MATNLHFKKEHTVEPRLPKLIGSQLFELAKLRVIRNPNINILKKEESVEIMSR